MNVQREANLIFLVWGRVVSPLDIIHLYAHRQELFCVAVSQLQFIELQNSSVKEKIIHDAC